MYRQTDIIRIGLDAILHRQCIDYLFYFNHAFLTVQRAGMIKKDVRIVGVRLMRYICLVQSSHDTATIGERWFPGRI